MWKSSKKNENTFSTFFCEHFSSSLHRQGHGWRFLPWLQSLVLFCWLPVLLFDCNLLFCCLPSLLLDRGSHWSLSFLATWPLVCDDQDACLFFWLTFLLKSASFFWTFSSLSSTSPSLKNTHLLVKSVRMSVMLLTVAISCTCLFFRREHVSSSPPLPPPPPHLPRLPSSSSSPSILPSPVPKPDDRRRPKKFWHHPRAGGGRGPCYGWGALKRITLLTRISNNAKNVKTDLKIYFWFQICATSPRLDEHRGHWQRLYWSWVGETFESNQKFNLWTNFSPLLFSHFIKSCLDKNSTGTTVFSLQLGIPRAATHRIFTKRFDHFYF